MKKRTIRIITCILALLMCLLAFAGCGRKWPAKPIEFVSTASPGGGNDTFTRAAAQAVAEVTDFPQPMNVINKVGGSNEVAFQYIKDIKHEYDIVTIVTGDVRGWELRDSDHCIDDFKPVCMLASDVYFLLVAPDAPFNSIDELIAYSNENPGTVTMSGSGTGGNDWLGWQLMCEAGLDADYVPYEGGGEATTAVVAGDVTAVWQTPATASAQVEGGTLKAIAVSTEERVEWEALKDVPTSVEQGHPELVFSQWRGIAAPQSMSDENIATLVEVFKEVSDSQWWKDNYLDTAMLLPTWAGPDEFMDIMRETETESIEIVAALAG